jgi:hypothetical protein
VGILAATSALAAAPPSGDSQIHARAGKSELVVTTTSRLAGAIGSVTWDGLEFINTTDHGRELQSACSFDFSPTANAETFNPTEAGSLDDGAGPTSTSRLLEIIASGNNLRTRTQMAFWLAPGERSDRQLALNTNVRSDVVLTKDVHISVGKWSQALDYHVTYTVPKNAHHTAAQFEALTGYLSPKFEKFWQFNFQTGKLEPLSDGPGELTNPVVLATADGRHAMGIYAPPHDQSVNTPLNSLRYGRWKFKDAQVVKWNCVFRVQNSAGIPNGDYSYHLLVPIGTLEEVEAMLHEWNR